MPVVVAFISQKGGVGKSTLARALGAVAAHGGLNVMIADLDPQQHTLMRWEETRRDQDVDPVLAVEAHATVADAMESGGDYELLILDAPGRASEETLDIARVAHVVVQPTGPSIDDLFPGVLLFHELVAAGIPRERLAFALCRVLTKDEENAARAYLGEAQYVVLPGSIPERAAYREAQNRGRALTETDGDTLDKRTDALMEGLLLKVAAELERATQPAQEKSRKRGERR